MGHHLSFIRLLSYCVLMACGGAGPIQSQGERNEDSFQDGVPSGTLPRTIVTDKGTLSVEEDYIPGVVACEIGRRFWGGAAMEAQAIAARTYLARYLERTKGEKVIPIGPRFQCWKRTNDDRVRQAALATANQVLRYKGALITGNYVAGTPHLTAGCDPLPPSEAGYTPSTWTLMLEKYREGRKKYG
ncbi:MAG: SpoIID/LytB domain-containing protein, partial [Bradymonadia bacterium]